MSNFDIDNDDAYVWINVPRPTSQPTSEVKEMVTSDQITVVFNITQKTLSSNCFEGGFNSTYISAAYARCDLEYTEDLVQISRISLFLNSSDCELFYTVSARILPNFINSEDAYTTLVECLNSSTTSPVISVSNFNTKILNNPSSVENKPISFDWLTFFLVCFFFSLIVILLIVWAVFGKARDPEPESKGWAGTKYTFIDLKKKLM